MRIKLILKRNFKYLAYTFFDTHKGERRFNIVAHGSDFSSKPKEISFGRRVTARDLYLELIRNSDVYQCNNIRLLSCHSADGYNYSFACELSRYFPYKMIKGYAGEIRTNFSPDIIGEIMQTEGVDMVHRMISENDRIKLEKFDIHFHSVTFKNGTCVKQHYGERQVNVSKFLTL